MTDASPGPGWWRASDGQWYPPHLHPDAHSAVATDVAPGALHAQPQTAPFQAAQPQTAPFQTAPEREPIDWARIAAERDARRRRNEWRHRRRIIGGCLAAVGALAILYAVARDDGDDTDPVLSPDTTTAAGTPAPTTVAPTTTAPVESTTAAPATTLPGPATVSVFELQPGTCVDDNSLAPGLVEDVTVVPCDQPHSHEVYHRATYTGATTAYDAAAVGAFAGEQCTQGFASYVGVPYDRSRYYFLQLAPSEESWNERGDRDVVCLLFLQGAQLTGTAQSTAQ